MAALSTLLALTLSTGAGAASEAYFTTQLTSNSRYDSQPQVSGDRVVWSGNDGTDGEIFTWTPAGGIVQLTSNGVEDYDPQVSGDRVVWCSDLGAGGEIFTWTPAGGTVQLTTNTYREVIPRVSGDRVVWYRFDGTGERIFTWTPAGGTVEIPLNGYSGAWPELSGDRIAWISTRGIYSDVLTWTPRGATVQLTSDGHANEELAVSGDRVVWFSTGGPWEIFTWTPTEGTVQITSNGYSDGYPEVSGDRVVWYGYDGADRDIFTWTPGDGITQLTANSYQEDHQHVSGDRVVWIGEDGTDYEVFAWTPAGGTVKITSNSREEREPQVSGDRIVWTGNDGTDDEIFTAIAGPVGAFTDVGPDTHYKNAIEDLNARGLLSGYPDGTFRPESPVLRQQFAKMIVRALGYPVSDADICLFTDVQKSLPGSSVDPLDLNYPDHYVAVCASHGITEGKTTTTFAPYDHITRQQLITMVVRAANLPDIPPYYVPPFNPGQFYPSEHYLNARRAAWVGLLNKIDGLGPDSDFFSPATRGEVAALLYNLLNRPTPGEEEEAISQAIGLELALYPNEFSLAQLKAVGSWAGTLIINHLNDSDRLELLLQRVGAEWTVVNYGTGYTATDWMADGAPQELAEWLEATW